MDLRIEYNRSSFRKMLKEKLGESCFNCGSNDGVQYHHIVPLFLGGTNALSNIVPLCSKCHKAAHCGRHMSEYKGGKSSGRPRKTIDGYSNVIESFLKCEIGMRECKNLLHMTDASKLTDKPWFKEYLKSNGIIKYRNNIDVIRSNGIMRPGKVIGYIEYNNGTRLEFTE
ncbi:HNH endonuclease signature motif containing protein [Enterocloster citroniae]|uniref:HNH endonuclease signature motif containing protein n=1 Tax=Enterocloster citroniae TaxID=358743 RepID=UPI002E7626E9|nr:HNH endonuclease signature motif containing protein [Enterocloster citroniae]